MAETAPELSRPLLQPFRAAAGDARGRPGCCSRALFGWVGPLLRRGSTQLQLQCSDLLPLPPDLEPADCGSRLWHAWERECAARGRERASVLRALFSAFGRQYLLLGLTKLANDALNFAGPLLLNALLLHLGSRTGGGGPSGSADWGEAWWRDAASPVFGGACAALLAASLVLKAFLNAHYGWRMTLVAGRMRAAVMVAVFRKALLASAADVAAIGEGRVQTLMSVDADRLVNLVFSFHELWSLPAQMGLALWLLYTQVRYGAAAGLAVVVLLVPANRALATRIQAASIGMMAAKDRRVRWMAEVLRGIRQIKAYAWEGALLRKVAAARSAELSCLAVKKYLDALCVFSWAATPPLFSLATFGALAALGVPLSARSVFTALALFNVLLAPINAFPWVVNGVVEALVSLRRVSSFLRLPESAAPWPADDPGNPGSGSHHPPPSVPAPTERTPLDASQSPLSPEPAIILRCASFAWAGPAGGPGSSSTEPRAAVERRVALENTSLEVRRGELVAVVGEVGAGKSALLAALLGELRTLSGTVRVSGSLAYVGQDPWLMRGTIRDNILLGAPVEPQCYARALACCALHADLRDLPAADLTRVGDRGGTLSGGQRARLALARALYHDRDVYLLDDILAAVDATVGAWLLRHVLLGRALAGKTVLLATHSPAALAAADRAVRPQGGCLVAGAAAAAASGTGTGDAGSVPRARGTGDGSSSADELEEAVAEVLALLAATSAAGADGRTGADGKDDGETGTGLQDGTGGATEEQPEGNEEGRQVGHVRWRVCAGYARAMRLGWVALILVSMALMQATRNGNDLWLAYWVSHTGAGQPGNLSSSGGSYYVIQHALAAGLSPGGNASCSAPELCAPFAGLRMQRAGWPVLPTGDALPGPVPLPAGLAGGGPAPGPSWDVVAGPDEHSGMSPEVRFYLTVLLSIGAANSAFTLVRAFSFAQGGLAAARALHDSLLRAVLALPAAFFDATPGGRILNRFSSDTAAVDDSLPFILNILLNNIFIALGVGVVLCGAQPYLLAALLPVAAVYRAAQRYYRSTSRELRRLDAVTRSPVYTAFSEALSGGPTIRAYGAQPRFLRAAEAAVAWQQRASLSRSAAAAWLGLRLQLVAAGLAGLVAGVAVAQHAGALPGGAGVAAGLVGLTLSYVLPLTDLLNSLLTSSAESEQEMVAVERVMDWCRLPGQPDVLPGRQPGGSSGGGSASAEAAAAAAAAADAEEGRALLAQQRPAAAPQGRKALDPGPHWLRHGAVSYHEVWVRYGPRAPPALRGISLDVAPGTKLGICGRTGAGKSTLVSCLLRLTEVSSGQITIDGRDIGGLPLRRLRAAIGTVPQAPFLFDGSVRDNLDPLRCHTDAELVSALQCVQLWDQLLSAAAAAGGMAACAAPRTGAPKPALAAEHEAAAAEAAELPAEAVERALALALGEGSACGLSQGQAQLLCLARVLLRSPALVLLDECTASVDPRTAATIHQVVREALRHATVLQVAHRLEAVHDCDSVVVMEQGCIVEQGPPAELAETPGSAYAALLAQLHGDGAAAAIHEARTE